VAEGHGEPVDAAGDTQSVEVERMLIREYASYGGDFIKSYFVSHDFLLPTSWLL
jgi:hypothetical protein